MPLGVDEGSGWLNEIQQQEQLSRVYHPLTVGVIKYTEIIYFNKVLLLLLWAPLTRKQSWWWSSCGKANDDCDNNSLSWGGFPECHQPCSCPRILSGKWSWAYIIPKWGMYILKNYAEKNKVTYEEREWNVSLKCKKYWLRRTRFFVKLCGKL